MIPGHYEGSPLEAVNRAKEALHEGASRVMGGGLVGTTINFVPVNEKKEFLEVMHAYYGEKKVVEVSIPPLGAHIVE
jgi:galactokinase